MGEGGRPLCGRLSGEAGQDLGAPDYPELITELLESSPEFTAIWARQDVLGRGEGLKRYNHAVFGRFDLEYTSFQVAEQPSLRLALYTPADDRHSERTVQEIVAAQQVPM